MNLSKLFELQKVLDERIVHEHGLEGRDLLPNKILSLQVEFGELANEWQGFKHWKVDPQPKPNMLEEYVDCLHFVLSIGLEIGYTNLIIEPFTPWNLVGMFIAINERLMMMHMGEEEQLKLNYNMLFDYFIGLGEMLGFTTEQIEKAYLRKNQINHQRQEEGY